MFDGLKLLQNQFARSIDSSAVALVTEGQDITYEELVNKSIGLAAFWKNQGLRPADKIAVQLPNSVEFIQCYIACILGGYIIVPLNSDLSQRNLDYISQLVQPKLLVNKFEQIQYHSTKNYEFNSKNDTISAIFFTSGTTSFPKAVCHCLGNMLANVVKFNELVGIDRNTRMMHIMPMGYMAGFLNTILSPLIAGGTVVVTPQFNAKEAINFWQPAIESNVNALWLTPTMAALLARLNRTPTTQKWTKNNLRHTFVGTAPLPKATKETFESTFGIPTLESYGMTEILIVASNYSEGLQKQGSVGHLLEDIEVEARDKQGSPLPKGEIGELFVKTPFALKGYLQPETGQINSPLEEGWFATGDYGYFDADDDLFITGRIKDLIIHGGTNVSPTAVENLLMVHPNIQEAAVLGKPHPFWGEEVVAFVIMKADKSFIQESIDEYCKNHLEFDAVPTTYKIVNDLPRSSTGKVKKHILKETL
jgi:long-chain acyl-CoA synthetase